MQGMLSLLLFAGALHVDLSELRALRWQIGASPYSEPCSRPWSIGATLWWVLPWIGAPVPLTLLPAVRALISPTDPIAVMGILKSAGAPKVSNS